MQPFDRESFAHLLKQNRIKPRLVKELRFNPESINDWSHLELLAVPTRSSNEGVLLIQTDQLYITPYELTIGLKDKQTGRSKPVTCDFCYTWQQGSKAGLVTFRTNSDNRSLTFLCCADLRCSLHVRDLTGEAALSRTQLREDIDTERRILRLRSKLSSLLTTLNTQPAQ